MLKSLRRDLMMVPYELLVIKEGFNVRYDMGDLEGLANSIEEEGVKEPMRGYKEKGTQNYIIVNGHRRHAAIGIIKQRKPGFSISVPLVPEPQKYSEEQRVFDMFLTNDGKILTPLEQAEGIRRLKNYSYSDAEIAKKIGKSTVYVWKLNSLNTAPKKLRSLIEKETISASLAMEIVAKGEEEVEKFLQAVSDGQYDTKQVNGQELFQDTNKAKPNGKITAKDVRPINSFKVFKKVAKDIDDKQLDEEKKKFFKWLCRMMNNELTEESIKRFFK